MSVVLTIHIPCGFLRKKIRNSRVTAHQDSPLKMKKEGGEALKIKQ